MFLKIYIFLEDAIMKTIYDLKTLFVIEDIGTE